jgi:hypothetical protein
MHMHYGTAMLRLSSEGCLTGDYYAGRDRRTFGRICCKREPRLRFNANGVAQKGVGSRARLQGTGEIEG